MVLTNTLQKAVTLSVSVCLGLTAPAFIAGKAIASEVILTSPELQLAQVDNACYEVIIENGTYIQEEPTVYSGVTGSVVFGQNVTVVPGGTENWTLISNPVPGYVWAEWLKPCQTLAQLPPIDSLVDSCRMISAENSAPVWQVPSVNGTVVGYIGDRQTITIQNLGANGWVPVLTPVPGYISVNYLTYC